MSHIEILHNHVLLSHVYLQKELWALLVASRRLLDKMHNCTDSHRFTRSLFGKSLKIFKKILSKSKKIEKMFPFICLFNYFVILFVDFDFVLFLISAEWFDFFFHIFYICFLVTFGTYIIMINYFFLSIENQVKATRARVMKHLPNIWPLLHSKHKIFEFFELMIKKSIIPNKFRCFIRKYIRPDKKNDLFQFYKSYKIVSNAKLYPMQCCDIGLFYDELTATVTFIE